MGLWLEVVKAKKNDSRIEGLFRKEKLTKTLSNLAAMWHGSVLLLFQVNIPFFV